MNELLRELLNQLEALGEYHEELYDSECRERISQAMFDGFIKPLQGFRLPEDFGLYSADANLKVRDVIGKYVEDANQSAANAKLVSFHERLAAFQNREVRSDGQRLFFDDLFGYWRPEHFDERGDFIG